MQHESTEDLRNRFTYHPANAERATEHEAVRGLLLDAASTLDHLLPPGRERAVALTKLEEAMFWANASIARQP